MAEALHLRGRVPQAPKTPKTSSRMPWVFPDTPQTLMRVAWSL